MKVKVGNEVKVVNRCMWLGSNSFLQLLIVIVNGNAGIALTMLVLYVLGFRNEAMLGYGEPAGIIANSYRVRLEDE